jgi:hypothetical protein
MKMYQNLKNVAVFLFITSALLASSLSSCIKGPANANYTPPQAGLMVVQAIPDEPPVDIVINATEINQTPVTFGQNSGYLAVSPGSSLISFYVDATASAILSDTLNLNTNTAHSLFLANKVTSPQVFLLTDTLKQPSAGNAAIRFIDLSPDAPAVDLVQKGGAVLVAGRSFKGYSSFAPITGNANYTFEVHPAGTSTVLATTGPVRLLSGFVYTIWLQGLAAGTTTAGDQLSVSIINNAGFL